MSRKITTLDTNNIIKEYLAGKSVLYLARQNNVCRQVIQRILAENNVAIRNRSQSMYVRMAHTPTDERKRLAHAANIAKRGSHNTPEMLHKRALAHQRRIGVFEQEFIDALSNAGIAVTPQEPFLSYNLDLGCGNIAVEIHTQFASPLSTHHVKKLMNCVNAGKSMIYVWISPRHLIVDPACYDKVIALVQEFSRNPSPISQYWVVRSTGEVYAQGTFN
jgi:hypothetical protein